MGLVFFSWLETSLFGQIIDEVGYCLVPEEVIDL
jgi:hypothetical protein